MTQTQIFKNNTKIRPPFAEKSYLFLTWNSKNSGNKKGKELLALNDVRIFIKGDGGNEFVICFI